MVGREEQPLQPPHPHGGPPRRPRCPHLSCCRCPGGKPGGTAARRRLRTTKWLPRSRGQAARRGLAEGARHCQRGPAPCGCPPSRQRVFPVCSAGAGLPTRRPNSARPPGRHFKGQRGAALPRPPQPKAQPISTNPAPRGPSRPTARPTAEFTRTSRGGFCLEHRAARSPHGAGRLPRSLLLTRFICPKQKAQSRPI